MSIEKDVKKALAILSATYPNYNLSKEGVAVYIELLKDIEAPALELAVKSHIAQSKWFPSISELRELALNLTTNSLPSGPEAWSEVAEQLRRVGSWGKPVFTHELIGKAVECCGGWRHLCASEVIGIERTHFGKVYETLAKRTEDDRRLLPEVRRLMLEERVGAREMA